MSLKLIGESCRCCPVPAKPSDMSPPFLRTPSEESPSHALARDFPPRTSHPSSLEAIASHNMLSRTISSHLPASAELDRRRLRLATLDDTDRDEHFHGSGQRESLGARYPLCSRSGILPLLFGQQARQPEQRHFPCVERDRRARHLAGSRTCHSEQSGRRMECHRSVRLGFHIFWGRLRR